MFAKKKLGKTTLWPFFHDICSLTATRIHSGSILLLQSLQKQDLSGIYKLRGGCKCADSKKTCLPKRYTLFRMLAIAILPERFFQINWPY